MRYSHTFESYYFSFFFFCWGITPLSLSWTHMSCCTKQTIHLHSNTEVIFSRFRLPLPEGSLLQAEAVFGHLADRPCSPTTHMFNCLEMKKNFVIISAVCGSNFKRLAIMGVTITIWKVSLQIKWAKWQEGILLVHTSEGDQHFCTMRKMKSSLDKE